MCLLYLFMFFLNDLYILYEDHLHIGTQTWVSGRLTTWVANYVPSGQNGLVQKLQLLPDNFGNLTYLAGLFIEMHNLIHLPESFSNLTNLTTLVVNRNLLESLPNDIGNLTNLLTLDLGFNQLETVPTSIGDLINLEYLFLFNNQLSTLPESICDLNLNWDGISPANYPYFACGGNELCDSELIPDCVENSANFNISLDPIYYSFLLDEPQVCCPYMGDMNGDDGWNVLDIVTLANCVLADNCSTLNNCSAGDMNGDGGYNVLDIVALANCIIEDNCSDV